MARDSCPREISNRLHMGTKVHERLQFPTTISKSNMSLDHGMWTNNRYLQSSSGYVTRGSVGTSIYFSPGPFSSCNVSSNSDP